MTPALAAAVADPVDLTRAREQLEALRERIGAGDESVTPSELAEAEDAVRLAELRIEAGAEISARDAERCRVERIAEIRASLASGFLHDQAAEVLARFDRAVEACADLYGAIISHEDELAGVIAELARLGPLPAGMRVSGRGRDRSAVVDGRSWQPAARYNSAVVAEAALTGIGRAPAGVLPAMDSDGRGALKRAATSASKVERLRRYAGAPASTPTGTATTR